MIEHTPTGVRLRLGRLSIEWEQPPIDWSTPPPTPPCHIMKECMHDALACADADMCLHPSADWRSIFRNGQTKD